MEHVVNDTVVLLWGFIYLTTNSSIIWIDERQDLAFFSLWPRSTFCHSVSTLAYSSKINNPDSAKIIPLWLCLWSPINWHFIVVVSYLPKPVINVPFGQRKLTWIYIITCLKVDLVWGAISSICHTHTWKIITSCPPLVQTNNSLLFYSNSKPVRDFQQETLSLKHMPAILERPKKDWYTSFGVNKTMSGITIQPWGNVAYRTGARYIRRWWNDDCFPCLPPGSAFRLEITMDHLGGQLENP